MAVTATRSHMMELRDMGAGDIVALDPATGDTCSADPRDYFWLGINEPLLNDAGEALILAVETPRHCRVL